MKTSEGTDEAPLPRGSRPLESRQNWLDLAETLVDGAVAHMSPNGAHVVLPGDPSKHGRASDGMEGYSRTLLLHAFRIAGEPSSASARHTDRYVEGLHNGLRQTGSNDAWLRIKDKGHAIPESASIALALSVARDQLWDPLESRAQARIVTWLSEAVRAAPYDNNWQLFAPVAGAFLSSVGVDVPGRAEARQRALASLAAWEEPDGWISDGDASTFDYYSSFALHFYPLMLASLYEDPEFAERRDAARRFLSTLPALISPEGAPVFFGRSLTYRFGMVASVSAGALADCLPWSPPVARSLSERVVNYFIRNGAVHGDGTLRRGWFGEDAALAQDYSGPAASYWVSKAFANLLLPEQDPYWSGDAPAPELSGPRVVAGGMLVATPQQGHVVRLANHVSVNRTSVVLRDDPEDAMYSRIEYSSASAPGQEDEVRCGSLSVIVRGRAAGPALVEPTEVGENWVTSRAQFRAPIVERSRLAPNEVKVRRSIHLEGFDALLGTIAIDDWFVHLAWFPGGFPWRTDLRWSGLPVTNESEQSPSFFTRGVSVSGGGVTSSLAGVLGTARRAAVRRVQAPPFASDAIAPQVAARWSMGHGARWFAVASAFGQTTREVTDIAVPHATRHSESEVIIRHATSEYCVAVDDRMTVQRRR